MTHIDDTKPKLTLIASDGISKGRRSGNKTASGLTVKQEAFAGGLAAGLSNADAYRQAYDATSMKQGTIHNEACKLAAAPHIAVRVDQLIREKQARNSMFTDKQREKHSDRIWRRLWELCDAPETPPAVKASLLSLGAKAAGMLTEQVRVENITSDSKSIEAEILERLQRLSA